MVGGRGHAAMGVGRAGWALLGALLAGALLALAPPAAAAGDVGPLASAGPDGFGYTLDGTIAYDWEPGVASTGAQIEFDKQGKNAQLGPFALPPGFSFNFYGDPKAEYWISSNGFITFTDPGKTLQCCEWESHLPSSKYVGDFIATTSGWFSYDSNDLGCGEVWVEERASPQRLILQFEDVCQQTPNNPKPKASFQLKLFATTNHIEVHYDYLDASIGCCAKPYIAGIESKDEANGLEYFSFAEPKSLNDLAVQYTNPNSAPVAKDDGDTDGDGTVDDAAFTLGKETPSILLDVLANDVDVDGDTLSAASLPSATSNGYGTLGIEADGRIRYTLDTSSAAVSSLGHGATLTDTFTYKAHDGLVASVDTATVTVRIDGVDHVPVLYRNTTLTVQEAHPGSVATAFTLSHLDASDADDPDGTIMFCITSLPAGALTVAGSPAAVGTTFTLAMLDAGQVKYMASASDPGPFPQDTFSVKVFDPDSETDLAYDAGNAQVVQISVTPWDDPPVPSFETLPAPVYEGLGTRFVDTSTAGDGPLGPFEWDFGDGTTATGQVISHMFPTAGLYPVRLTVTEGAHSISVTKDIEVLAYTAPVPSFIASDLEVEVGEAVTFTDTSTAGVVDLVAREWDFSGPSLLRQGNDPVVSVSFSHPGTYQVTLTVIDALGQRHQTVHEVVVTGSPATDPAEPWSFPAGMDARPRADAGPDVVALPGTVLRLSGTASPDLPKTTYAWTQVAGPDVPMHEEGTATPWVELPWVTSQVEVLFALTVERDGLVSESDMMRVVVDPLASAGASGAPLPSARFTADVSATGQASLQAAQAAVRYTWDFGDGVTAEGGPQLTHRYAKAGPYRVNLTVEDAFGRVAHGSQTVIVPETEPLSAGAPTKASHAWAWAALAGTVVVCGVAVAWATMQQRKQSVRKQT